MSEKSYWLRGCGPRGDPGISFALLAIMFLTLSQAVAAQEGQGVDQPAPAEAQVVNRLTQTAVQLGALTCAAKVQQVTSFLGVTRDTKAVLRRPGNPPDRNSLSLAMTLATDGTTGVALADFYPSQTGCKASYSLTVNLPQSCGDLRATGFAGLTEENKLAENITLLTGPNTLRVLLMEAGAGCNVIKTETLD